MTRAFVRQPAWTWYCDECGRSSGDLSITQGDLPTPEDMRLRGWFVAEVYGDLCPACAGPR